MFFFPLKGAARMAGIRPIFVRQVNTAWLCFLKALVAVVHVAVATKHIV